MNMHKYKYPTTASNKYYVCTIYSITLKFLNDIATNIMYVHVKTFIKDKVCTKDKARLFFSIVMRLHKKI
jgi:hypothetical protein